MIKRGDLLAWILYTVRNPNYHYNQEKEDHLMGKDNTKPDFTGQDIYVGIDTGKKGWKVTILAAEFEHKTFTQPPEPDALVGQLIRD